MWAYVCVSSSRRKEKQNPPLHLQVEIQQIEDEIRLDSYACDEILNHLRVLYVRYVEICNLVILNEVGLCFIHEISMKLSMIMC
ncbi:hypothetical protein Hanom_Chr09g00824351 [Helianthus anomalus]